MARAALRVAVAAFAVAGLFVVGGPSVAADACAVEVTLTPGERLAEVTAASPVAVTFDGNVSLSKLAGPAAYVSITASVTTGWAATVSPNAFEVGSAPSFTGRFTVTSVVPAATSATAIGVVTVTARAHVESSQCARDQAQSIITPAAYEGPSVAAILEDRIEADGGGAASFRARLMHETNVRDATTAYLRIEGPAGLLHNAPDQLLVAVSNPAGPPADITVTLDARAVVPGEHRVRLYLYLGPPDLQAPAASDEVVLGVPDRAPVPLSLVMGILLAIVVLGAAEVLASRR
jgi:hypothetical protein